MGQKTTLGLIVGNRGFFPDHLCDEGRKEMLGLLEAQGFDVVALTPEDTPFGSVETREQARKCAELFRRNADRIDGILVTLPNFGDERGVADSIRMADLDVPVLIHAYPDDPARMSLADRRDSFCGKMSACNNLSQYGIDYSLTSLHTVDPASDAFATDLDWFGAVCRVVRGLSKVKLGAIGARPTNFNTVRFSEKILESYGISVETLDLSEVLGRIGRLDDAAAEVQGKLQQVRDYIPTGAAPEQSLLKMAKLALVIDDWTAENDIVATAVQCWTALEEYLGIVPCTVMSMMSDRLMPSACEVDIMGALGMYALVLASGKPSALLDWNNNYGDDPDKCVLFHCSNLPRSCFSCVEMGVQDIIGGTVGVENTWGTCVGKVKTGPFTFVRVSTDDLEGEVVAYVGEGEFTDDPLDTFGGAGVARIDDLQSLLGYICEMGFEHHVAVNRCRVGAAVAEAMDKYLGWDVYAHL